MPAYPSSMSVRVALDDFLARYGFSRDEYQAKTYWIQLFGRRLRLPNPPSRRIMVPLHDLHHIATGWGADWRGEVAIGAWELRTGCTTATLWLINLSAALIGLIIAPKQTARAYRAGAGMCSLYRMKVSHSPLLDLSVGELRALIGVPLDGITQARQQGARSPAVG